MSVGPTTHRWLVATCDPAGPGRLPPRPLSHGELDAVLSLADLHGVLAAVLDNLQATCERYAPSRVSTGEREQFAGVLNRWRDALQQRTVFSMILRAQAERVVAALRAGSVRCATIKGPAFADRLYPAPAMRTFTDVDVLVAPECFDGVGGMMRDLGYRPLAVPMKRASGYGEESWVPGDATGGTVELHWNLVNSPTLRRRISVTLDDLSTESSSGDGTVPTPASLLLIAAVHAAASHGFDRLGPLMDLCQAVRGAAGRVDADELTELADRTGAGYALAAGLELAGRVFREAACVELRRDADLARPVAAGLLITPAVVVRQHARIDSLRRQTFRELLKRR